MPVPSYDRQLTPPSRDDAAWRFCVAPMLDWTDRHCRYFLRQISRHARLYTEMVTTGALLHGDVARHLRFDAAEHPIALQLGGADAQALARCAALGEEWGYDEINLNCGCPSDRVQGGGFGACLMLEPARVADAVRAMIAATSVPVSVKCRIGVDEVEPGPFLREFVRQIADAGCETLVIHARKAWLSGLSPKENREIPPLDPALVHAVAAEHPELRIIINGGLRDLNEAHAHLEHCAGVMVGRAAYEDPWRLASVDPLYHGQPAPQTTREGVVEAMRAYAERECAGGTPLHSITRHMLGLYRGEAGARTWRRTLSERVRLPGSGPELFEEALAGMASSASAIPHSPPLSEVHT